MATTSEKVLGVEIDVASADQRHELGTVVECNDGTTRRYVKAGAAIAQYDALIYNTAAAPAIYNWIPSAAANTPIMGIAQIAVTTQYYFWAVIGGACYCHVAAAGVAAGAALVTTAAAGELDDTAADADNALATSSGRGVIAIADNTPADAHAIVYVT